MPNSLADVIYEAALDMTVTPDTRMRLAATSAASRAHTAVCAHIANVLEMAESETPTLSADSAEAVSMAVDRIRKELFSI